MNSWSRFLPEKLTGLQLVKKSPTFYGIRSFITAFTSARHFSLSQINPVHTLTTHFLKTNSNIILEFTALVFQVVYFLQVSSQKPRAHFSPLRATCPAIVTLFDFVTRIMYGDVLR